MIARSTPFYIIVILLFVSVTLGRDVTTSLEHPFCFISHGCWGGKNPPSQRAVATLMGQKAAEYKAKFIIAAGDNFYTKGITSVDDPRLQSSFEDIYNAESLKHIPFLTALGNHDYRGDVWAQVNYTSRSSRWFMPHPYYERRFPEASLAVVVLDCPLLERCFNNRGKRQWAQRCWDQENQIGWLRQTLAATERDRVLWRVLVCHYPLYANGPHVNHPWLIELVEPLMHRYGAHLYINADNHYLQVSQKEGLAFVNSGGGGGYMPHKRTDAGYSVNRFNRYESMEMGVVVHCVESSRLRSIVYGVRGEALFTFDISPAPMMTGASDTATTDIDISDTAARRLSLVVSPSAVSEGASSFGMFPGSLVVLSVVLTVVTVLRRAHLAALGRRHRSSNRTDVR